MRRMERDWSQRTGWEVNKYYSELRTKIKQVVWNRLALEVEAERDILIDYWLNTDTNRQG